MTHNIRYATQWEYASVDADWPRCTRPEAIRHAYAAATEHAARYGDRMCELVRVDGKTVTTRENLIARGWGI